MVVVGFGWVGQANALALTKLGHQVFYYDIAPPVLRYKDKYADVYGKINSLNNPLEVDGHDTWYLICVGDRVRTDGSQDTTLIENAFSGLAGARGQTILRSTILPPNLKTLKFSFYFPEFLHEIHAVEECLNPFYFVLGKRGNINEPSFLKDWQLRAKKVFKGTPEQASYIKYLSNIWNAARIAFVNEFGDLAQDEAVTDFVLGKKNYLRYGKAFGGHCLPKDTQAFYTAHAAHGNTELMRSIYASNELHKKIESAANLQEWFSSWEDERRALGDMAMGALLWHKFNSSAPVRGARKNLRFIINTASKIIPERSLGEVKETWDGLARKNARYYANTKTASGKDVNEFEFKETGSDDYRKYVVGDGLVAPMLAKSNSLSALEIGCGLGRMTEFFPQHFAKVAGIDISEVMLESAKKRLTGAKNIELKISDGKNIAFPDNHFNLAFSYQTLQHMPTREVLSAQFKEIYRTLKPGGIAKLHLRTGRGPYKWHWAHGVSLAPAEAKAMAESAGFKFIKHEIEDPKSLWVWLVK